MNVTGLHWLSVNIGSGNGLVPSGNKPLTEPMLTQTTLYNASIHQGAHLSLTDARLKNRDWYAILFTW